jgi:disulfide bond formation protein DsbB
MSLIDEWRKLDPSDFALALGVLLAVIAPGFLTLYLYRPSLVESLDTFKLILFSISLTLPFVVLNFFAFELSADSNPDRASPGSILTTAMAGTSLVLYVALLISFLFQLTFRQHLGAIAGLQVLWFFFLWLVRRHERQGKT